VLWKDKVFVGENNLERIVALNIDSGAIVWTHDLGTEPLDSTSAIADGVLFVGGKNGYIFAVDAQTGTRKWETSVTSYTSNSPPAITTANGYVFSGQWNASAVDKNFTVLNASTGAIEWTYNIGSNRSYSPPAIANDIVYITTDGTTGTEIIAFEPDIATGTVTPPVITAALNCPDADITWTAASPSSYDRYTVYRAAASGGPYTQIATGLSTLSYTDSMPGQGLYYYVVEGYKSGSPGDKTGYSNEAYVDVDCDVTLSVAGQCTPILTWNPSGDPAMNRYTVRRSATSGGPWTDVGTNITATTWQDTGTADHTAYFYTVVAYRSTNPLKKSDPSNEVTMTTDCAPFDVEALAMCPDVLVTWNAPNSPVFNRFTVFRSTASGGPWTQIATGLSLTSYTDTPPASSGQTYYYVVQGYENGNPGNKSDYSPEAFVANFTCPYPEPQNLVATLKCPDIELTWNSVAEATGYHIYRATTSGGPYTLLEQEVASPYTDTTAATGSTYFYVVTAFYSSMAGQESGYSNEAAITKNCGTNTPYTYDYDCGNKIPPHFSAPTPDGELYRPWEVATDPAGNMYVSNSINNRIEKYDKDCKFIKKWGAPGNYPGQMTEPRGIVYNPSDGLIYVTDAYERVQAFTTDGAYSHGWYAPKAVSLAVDGAGSIYVVQHKLLGYLARYDTNGAPIAQWYMPNILGVGVDPTSGTVYVTTNTAIQALDSGGNVTATIGAGQVANPAGIHFSPDGRMFVSDTGARQVFIFQGGLLLDTVGQGGLAAGEFTEPTDVWVVDDKKLLVLDRQHDRVNIFSQK
jgi:fibronectin type 3 domain-containing protein/sugar lactone lactonase YvrE